MTKRYLNTALKGAMSRAPTVFEFVGLALIAYGVGLIFVPAGVIAAGVALAFIGYATGREGE